MFFAQAETVFNGISMEESLEVVTGKVRDISDDLKLISEENPTFPLAANKEEHLVCNGVKAKDGSIRRVVFTFADGRLKYILAHGNVARVLARNRKDTAMVYMDYEVYFADKLFLNKKDDLAWILAEEAMHPNLFSWVNPYIYDDEEPASSSPIADGVPNFIKMGAPMDEMKSVLEENSAFTALEELDGSDPNAQVQINCFGLVALGFSRKIEARFGNDRLNVVWILTGKGEESRIREALIKQFGKPVYKNEEWEIFNDWQVGLRKDKPEVLLMEKEIGLQYKSSYFKQ